MSIDELYTKYGRLTMQLKLIQSELAATELEIQRQVVGSKNNPQPPGPGPGPGPDAQPVSESKD